MFKGIQKPSSMNPFLNIICIFAIERWLICHIKIQTIIYKHEEDIIPTRILRYDGRTFNRFTEIDK